MKDGGIGSTMWWSVRAKKTSKTLFAATRGPKLEWKKKVLKGLQDFYKGDSKRIAF